MLKPPKSMFQDEIKLTIEDTSKDPENVYGEKAEHKTYTIKHVRVDLRTVYSGSNNDREIILNGTVIMMPPYTTPWISEFMPKKTLVELIGQRIEFLGRKFTIKNVNRDIEPFTNKIYQIKLEML